MVHKIARTACDDPDWRARVMFRQRRRSSCTLGYRLACEKIMITTRHQNSRGDDWLPRSREDLHWRAIALSYPEGEITPGGYQHGWCVCVCVCVCTFRAQSFTIQNGEWSELLKCKLLWHQWGQETQERWRSNNTNMATKVGIGREASRGGFRSI